MTLTMNSMEQNREDEIRDVERRAFMNENTRIYRTLSAAGAGDIVIGILVIAVGVAAGVIAIVNGARLLASRRHILL